MIRPQMRTMVDIAPDLEVEVVVALEAQTQLDSENMINTFLRGTVTILAVATIVGRRGEVVAIIEWMNIELETNFPIVVAPEDELEGGGLDEASL